ncbi:hypothetical protein SAMN04488067_10617 [Halorubrum xinjiangense]|uniref:Uncharacterized protein n=1 Tax=Halorubrum xinjiangense TaxID=261291 RepID=A0A1G7MD69_9EURY|nr:hypothetical protein [Halorubrum xinjiangense]SDF59713.1 hypothetical protein SAMN04488067_10617 [Halorubrum xinjiangense]
MDAATRSERYHLVCRDCSLERLCDVPEDAEGISRDHAVETGHRVAVERVE